MYAAFVPPAALPPFLAVIQVSQGTEDDKQLLTILSHALEREQYVVCFGI